MKRKNNYLILIISHVARTIHEVLKLFVCSVQCLEEEKEDLTASAAWADYERDWNGDQRRFWAEGS